MEERQEQSFNKQPMMYTKSNVRNLLTPLIEDAQAEASTQGPNYYRTFTNCDRTFADGSPRQIHPRITTSHVVLVIRGQQNGFFKAVSLQNGNPLVRFCGFTGSVRSSYYSPFTLTNVHLS